MKIDSPSSITSREASIRLEWISTRILPGVAVLLLSIPLCQWADSNLPNGIIPVSIIYLMIVIVLWSMYMAVQYAFVGIAQTWKNKTHACNNQTATNESTAQKPVFLLEAIPVYNESEGIDTACEAETAEEISETEVIEEAYMAETGELAKDNHVSVTYQQGIDDSRVLMTSTKVRQKARRRNWTPFMNTFYTSCLHLYMRKTWTSSVQIC